MKHFLAFSYFLHACPLPLLWSVCVSVFLLSPRAVIDQCLFKLGTTRTPEAKILPLYSHHKIRKGTGSLTGIQPKRAGRWQAQLFLGFRGSSLFSPFLFCSLSLSIPRSLQGQSHTAGELKLCQLPLLRWHRGTKFTPLISISPPAELQHQCVRHLK